MNETTTPTDTTLRWPSARIRALSRTIPAGHWLSPDPLPWVSDGQPFHRLPNMPI
jgi:hypothetical protein